MASALRYVAFLLSIVYGVATVAQQPFRIVCWNVENYFDSTHDTLRNDYDFTPEGQYRWTYSRFLKKRNSIYKVVVDLGTSSSASSFNPPAVVGLVEVENDHVLRELCLNTPLRRLGYRFIHYESPDLRGIDCAMLFLPSRFQPFGSRAVGVSDSSIRYFTRDILLVEGVMDSVDTLSLLICHLPSKRGGADAERFRNSIGFRLRQLMDSLALAHPSGIVTVMGDFNATSHESLFSQVMRMADTVSPVRFYDPISIWPDTIGTYKYQGRWECIDHILINHPIPIHCFAPAYLLEADENGLSTRPHRTYRGPVYIGGFSDHLPIYIDLPR